MSQGAKGISKTIGVALIRISMRENGWGLSIIVLYRFSFQTSTSGVDVFYLGSGALHARVV